MHRTVVLLGVLAASIAFAACGDDEASPAAGSGSAGERAVVRVAVVPVHVVAPVYLGIEKGFFADENLEVVPEVAQGGAEIIPAVISGETQVGISNTASIVLAASKGLPLRVVTPLGPIPRNSEGQCLCVKRDSEIQSLADLEDKRVAVGTLANIEQLTLTATLEREGVDVSRVDLVEIPLPDMPVALDSGRVDAAMLSEPFVTQAEANGVRVVSRPYVDAVPDLTIASYFTSAEYAENNADVLQRFTRALQRASRYADEHEAEVREIVPTYTKISPQVAQQISLEPFGGGSSNQRPLETTAELMLQQGLIEEIPDLQAPPAEPTS